jgi:hypothetical protein
MDEERYDRITGKPIDKSYLEKGLPDYLQKDLDVYKSVDPDDSIASEGPWYCLYATINEALNEGDITDEMARYLREKYLTVKGDAYYE